MQSWSKKRVGIQSIESTISYIKQLPTIARICRNCGNAWLELTVLPRLHIEYSISICSYINIVSVSVYAPNICDEKCKSSHIIITVL